MARLFLAVFLLALACACTCQASEPPLPVGLTIGTIQSAVSGQVDVFKVTSTSEFRPLVRDVVAVTRNGKSLGEALVLTDDGPTFRISLKSAFGAKPNDLVVFLRRPQAPAPAVLIAPRATPTPTPLPNASPGQVTQPAQDQGWIFWNWGATDYGRQFSGIMLPREKSVPIHYDTSARLYNGTVWVNLTVGIDGKVSKVTITQSSGDSDLDQLAVQKVNESTWFPATQDGQPMEYTINFSIRFY